VKPFDMTTIFNVVNYFFLTILSAVQPFYGLCFKTSDAIYIESVSKLNQLSGLDGKVVYVTDSIRGGVFVYYAAGKFVSDNGTVWNAKNGGYWCRQYNRSEGIDVFWFGAKFDGRTDDSRDIQLAINKGGIINFPADKIAKVNESIRIDLNGTILHGNNSILDFSGKGFAIEFSANKNNVFPVRVIVDNLNIIVENKSSGGIHWCASYSTMLRCGITLKNSDQVAVRLQGDKYGTGSYYNYFGQNFIQGSRNKGIRDNTGWQFVSSSDKPYRCPNSNTWQGGRIGQCDTGMVISGYGNIVNQVAVEGCATGFQIGDDVYKVSCSGNKIVNCYFENTDLGFFFQKNSKNCSVETSFMTGLKKVANNLGTKNIINNYN